MGSVNAQCAMELITGGLIPLDNAQPLPAEPGTKDTAQSATTSSFQM